MTIKLRNTESIASGRKPGNRLDPYCAFNFIVEIDGITAGGFTEVSGLSITTDVERKTFGGENHKEYLFIKGTKYTDLTLKHGITDLDILWNWYDQVIKGKVKRKNGTIYLYDSGEIVMWWDFIEAFPVKWEGPSFNAASSTIAIETLTLAHNGLTQHNA